MSTFTTLGLREDLLKAVTKLGFETPTPVQDATIPYLLDAKNDLIALAQTGTGKTAAFGLPLLQRIDPQLRKIQALILCPTRELCLQITKDLESYAVFMPTFSTVAVYGGASIQDQIRKLKQGVQVVVATPGRLIDLLDRRTLDIIHVDYVILDEADEMLNMGFKDAIDDILSKTGEDKNVWLFSATMPNEVRSIAKNYMNNPHEITIGNKNTSNVNIVHEYYVTKAREKYMALKRIVDFHPDIFAIVFARTKLETQEIAEQLIRDGYNADSLHGDLTQPQRDKVMGRFREKSIQLLVATDVAARGIDVNDITHVINYTLPDDTEVYLHRSGRTARAGKMGVSVIILNSREQGRIRELERFCKIKCEKKLIPSGEQVCEAQLIQIVHKLHDVEVNEVALEKFLPKIFEEMKDISREDIIKRFASLEFNRFLEYYKRAPDLNFEGETRDRDASRFQDNSGMTELFISVGEMEGLERGNFLKFLKQFGIVVEVGRINVKKTYSFFHIKPEDVEETLQKLSGEKINGRSIRVEVTGSRGEREGKQREKKRFGTFEPKRGNFGEGRRDAEPKKDFSSEGGGRKRIFGDKPRGGNSGGGGFKKSGGFDSGRKRKY